jgi:hypothetical protein
MEPINMLEYRLNLFPAKFRWRGRVYRIDAVTECKTVNNPAGRSEAYHFWVRCEGKLLHLSQLLTTKQWLLQTD